jgi:hypothetical protein
VCARNQLAQSLIIVLASECIKKFLPYLGRRLRTYMRDRTYSNYFNTQTTVPRCFSINTRPTSIAAAAHIYFMQRHGTNSSKQCVITLFAAAAAAARD